MIIYAVVEPDFDTVVYLETKADALEFAAVETRYDKSEPWNDFKAEVKRMRVEKVDRAVLCSIANAEPPAAWCEEIKTVARFRKGKRVKR